MDASERDVLMAAAIGARAEATAALENRTMDKVTWRLVPLLTVCFFIAFLDRVNVGFANASMSTDLGLSAAAFGGAAGIFFVGYFFFEVPSNLALNRFGARVWIARIMFTWGVLSGAQAFVTGEASLNIVRLLLGIAEAGFFPASSFTSRCGSLRPIVRELSACSWLQTRFRPLSVRRFPVSFSTWRGSADCMAGNGCSWSRPCRRW
jgi:hypothetical protein